MSRKDTLICPQIFDHRTTTHRIPTPNTHQILNNNRYTELKHPKMLPKLSKSTPLISRMTPRNLLPTSSLQLNPSTPFHISTPSSSSFSTSPPPIHKHYILTYKYPPTILTDRVPHRPAHVGLAKEHKASGTLLYAGGLSASISSPDVDRDLPVEGCFLFSNEDAALEFVKMDPYVKEGIVKDGDWTLKEWACVVVPE